MQFFCVVTIIASLCWRAKNSTSARPFWINYIRTLRMHMCSVCIHRHTYKHNKPIPTIVAKSDTLYIYIYVLQQSLSSILCHVIQYGQKNFLSYCYSNAVIGAASSASWLYFWLLLLLLLPADDDDDDDDSDEWRKKCYIKTHFEWQCYS